MCNLCHAPECEPNAEKGLHYPHKDHSELYLNLFPGQCGASVVWGFFGVYDHNVDVKIEELNALEAEAKKRHHNLLMATANTKESNTKLLESCGWHVVHSFGSKYGGARALDLWVKDI